jgi:HSP20 family protein
LVIEERRKVMQDAIHPLNSLQDPMDRLWSGGRFSEGVVYPAINVWDDGESFHAEAELPGHKIEDVELFVAGSQFQIRGRRAFERREGWAVHRKERASGEYSRVMTFPADIDAGKVQATLKDGVLSVTLPKAPSAKPRKIEVKDHSQQK